MSCERLICAACAGPVVEGHCAACRTTRAHVHTHGPRLTPQMLVALASLLAALVVLATYGRL